MKAAFAVILSLLMLSGAARAQINPVLQPSRTNGVAPLMVFFDATGTTAASTRRPFRELEYRWNFGDADSRWAHGARPGRASRNVTTGAVAAHVYEKPGTYTATVSVVDGRSTATRKVTINVADPDAVFAGTRTVCFSTGELGYEGCPAGAQRVRISDYSAAINRHKGSGKRLLFRRGETFNAFRPAVIASDGPGIVGAFGPAGDPRPVLWNTANGNAIEFSGHSTPRQRDWRVMDLTFLGSSLQRSYGIALLGGIDQLTLLRLSMRRQRIGVMADSNLLDYWNRSRKTSGHHIWDQLAVVDCEVGEVKHGKRDGDKGYGAYLAGERLFFAGNLMNNGGTAVHDVSHVARFSYLGKAVLAHNTLMNPGPEQHVIKLHAPRWGDRTTEARGIGGGYTRWVVIADNKIVGANNPWLVAVGPQNGGRDERVIEMVSERNWIVAGPGMQVAQIYWATAVTIRHNIVDASGGSQWQVGVTIGRRGVEPPPERIDIYNETYYSSRRLDRGHFAGINVESRTRSVTARNNLAYAPNVAKPSMFDNACGACLSESNNSTGALIKSRLPFAIARPSAPADFAAANYAAGNGAAVPHWMDFFLNLPRPGGRDMGAVYR